MAQNIVKDERMKLFGTKLKLTTPRVNQGVKTTKFIVASFLIFAWSTDVSFASDMGTTQEVTSYIITSSASTGGANIVAADRSVVNVNVYREAEYRKKKTANNKNIAYENKRLKRILLEGRTDFSHRFGSGWINLVPAKNFKKGDILRLAIGGTAKKIKIRLLPQAGSPETTEGMLDSVIDIPEKDRVISLKFYVARKNIKQISVHGGEKPWDSYPLGSGNGPATLDSAELLTQP